MAELEKTGKDVQIITQNIDGLHQKAGSTKVYEVHGTTFSNCCDNCGKNYAADFIWNCSNSIPRCDCGGIVRPDVVLYGERLPENAIEKAIHALKTSEVLIIVGTSLKVPPVAFLPQYFYGETMIVINQQPTIADSSADLVFHEDMIEVFQSIHS